MLLEHERYYGLGMDALVTVRTWSTNVIVVAPGCSGDCMLLEHERHHGLHGCSRDGMLLEQERYFGLGVDALTVCSWNTNGIMVCTWMLWCMRQSLDAMMHMLCGWDVINRGSNSCESRGRRLQNIGSQVRKATKIINKKQLSAGCRRRRQKNDPEQTANDNSGGATGIDTGNDIETLGAASMRTGSAGACRPSGFRDYMN